MRSLSLQISSEVYLFSHIKGKKHQQAVRENSSIQGRELSDEEVVSSVVFISVLNVITLSSLRKSVKGSEEGSLCQGGDNNIFLNINCELKGTQETVHPNTSGSCHLKYVVGEMWLIVFAITLKMIFILLFHCKNLMCCRCLRFALLFISSFLFLKIPQSFFSFSDVLSYLSRSIMFKIVILNHFKM